jgi:hypothetical protein
VNPVDLPETQPMLYDNYRLKIMRLLMPWSLLLLMSMVETPSYAQCDFNDVAAEQGITHQFRSGVLGSGVSFMDFDGDGWEDLTFGTSKGELVEVYKNNQGNFDKVTLQGITNDCESKQILWVDFDNDGDKDLFYTCAEVNIVLYRNEGDLIFRDVTTEMDLITPDLLTMGANWADFDRDGWLDLYVTYYGTSRNQLFRNLQGEGFENVTIALNADPAVKPTFCGVVFDYDGDGWEDIYLANDRSTRNDLFRNLNGSGFEDVSIASQSNLAMDAMGTTLLDLNADGLFEIYVSNSPAGNALLFNNGDGTFTDIAEETGTLFSSVGWGVNTLDFDNDACPDLYVSGSTIGTSLPSSILYQGQQNATFEATQFTGMKADTMASFSNAIGDFNHDGRMDIVATNSNTTSQLWQNNCTSDYHWLKVQLEGTLSNRDAIGTRAVAYTNGLANHQYKTAGISFMAQNTDYLHFGLANFTRVDSLIVYWPSGLIDKILNPEIDQLIHVKEGTAHIPVAVNTSHAIDNLCDGQQIILSINLHGHNTEILWNEGSLGAELILSESGNYKATITAGELEIESEVVKVDFRQNPDVTYEVMPVTNDSQGEIVITELAGPYNYFWSHDASLNSPVASNLAAGNYTVKISDESNCSVLLTITVPSEVVTSLDNPLTHGILYQHLAGQLNISIPSALRAKLQHYQVLNAAGKTLHQSNYSFDQHDEILIPGIPARQIVLVQLQFMDGRVVKKLLLPE